MVGKKMIRENPVLIYMTGLCPAVAVTTSVMNSLVLGTATLAVLLLAGMVSHLMRKVIPTKMETGFHIIVIAGFTTMVQLLLDAYLPEVSTSLGIFVGLIAVNCIVIENVGFARKNSFKDTLKNSLGLGLGFLLVLLLMGAIREVAGPGTFFGISIFENIQTTNSLLMLVPGGLLVLAALIVFYRWMLQQFDRRKKGGLSA